MFRNKHLHALCFNAQSHAPTSLRRCRPLHTTCVRHLPVAKSAIPHLLYRNPERPLPTLKQLSTSRQWIRTMPIFIAIITVSALSLFNYQKINSPVITATLYALRTNQDVRDVLGDQVYFANRFAWIWGQMNLVQGKIDVTFEVKGTRNQGTCRFRARRFGGRGGTVSLSRHVATKLDNKILTCVRAVQDFGMEFDPKRWGSNAAARSGRARSSFSDRIVKFTSMRQREHFRGNHGAADLMPS